MRYEIEIWRDGNWRITAWGGDDLPTVRLRAKDIAENAHPSNKILKVRIVEVLLELDAVI